MKTILLGVLLCTTITTNSAQKPQNIFKVTSFTDMPKDMEGCGEAIFLNKKDEKTERYIFYTDYVRGLICVNNKMILISRPNKVHNERISVFYNKDYTFIIKYGIKKATGDEDYDIKSALVTLKYHSKIVWTKSVIGGGGC